MGEHLRVKEIAERFDISPATVTNWKRYYDDFPASVGTTEVPGPNGIAALWDLDEVKAWAKKRGLPDKTKTRVGKRDRDRDDVILNHLNRLKNELDTLRREQLQMYTDLAARIDLYADVNTRLAEIKRLLEEQATREEGQGEP